MTDSEPAVRVTRSWRDHNRDEPVMRCRLQGSRMTIQQLSDYLAEHYPHLDIYNDVTVTGFAAVWEEPPSADEAAQIEIWRARQAERHEAWERKTYAQLKAKFEVEL